MLTILLAGAAVTVPVWLMYRLRHQTARWARDVKRDTLWMLALIVLVVIDVVEFERLSPPLAQVILGSAVLAGLYYAHTARRSKQAWSAIETQARPRSSAYRKVAFEAVMANASERFGPNHVVVSRFLARLSHLSAGEWQEIVSRGARMSYQPLSDASRPRERQAAREAVLAALGELVMHTETGSDSHVGVPFEALDVAGRAAEALVVHDQLEPRLFHNLYRPFEAVVPRLLLGSGIPPDPGGGRVART